MKVIFLAPFGIRPKGTVIARMLPLAVELQRLGHVVTIIAPPYTNPEDSGVTETVRGVKLVNVALPKAGKALAALPLAWRMFRTAIAERPDIVHLFKPKGYGGLAAMLMILMRRFGLPASPLFVDTDDWEGKGGMNDLHRYSTAEKRLFAFQERWLSRHAAGVTAASRELERLTVGLGVARDRILYLPNGVTDTPPGNGSVVRHRLCISPELPLLLLYTRFFEFSQERLYRTLAGIHAGVPGARILVVGKGRHGEDELLQAASRKMGFADVLIMAGWLEPQEIPDYLAAADVALYPLDDTLVNRAKCPAKLTEIIRAGVAVVADRVGQATEYIREDRTGLLCDPESPDEMVDKTVLLLQDHQRRERFAAAGKQYIEEQYTWRDYAAKLAGFYQR
jgi:glycosyltransferase involved in cell wall biosynthesis